MKEIQTYPVPNWDCWRNGAALARAMQSYRNSERRNYELHGYEFDLGNGERAEFRSYCPKMETVAGHLMALAMRWQSSVVIYKTMNSNVGARVWRKDMHESL